MRSPANRFLASAVSFGCLSLSIGLLFAAEEISPYGKVDPAVSKKVERELSAFAKDLSRERRLEKKTVFALLTKYLRKNPQIYGAAFAFAPREKKGKLIKSSPYVYRSGEKFIEKELMDSYDYTAPDQKWYVAPVKLGKPAWSEPYYDRGGGEAWMTTYSIPIYSGGKVRRLIGVVTSDVLIPGK